MRADLQSNLYRRHPAIFRQKDLPETYSCMARGIECGDGWFRIIEALCATLEIHAHQTGHPVPQATQIKQKFGRLRAYITGDCPWCAGAIDMTEKASGLFDEADGHLVEGNTTNSSPESSRIFKAMAELLLQAIADALFDTKKRTLPEHVTYEPGVDWVGGVVAMATAMATSIDGASK